MGFAIHLIPVMRVAREQTAIAHDQGDASRVKGFLDEFEEAARVALPRFGVSGE